jgi:hypothetical protein
VPPRASASGRGVGTEVTKGMPTVASPATRDSRVRGALVGPFDVLGDAQGCFAEVEALLGAL